MLRFSFLASLSQFCEGPSAPAMTLTRKKERVVGLAVVALTLLSLCALSVIDCVWKFIRWLMGRVVDKVVKRSSYNILLLFVYTLKICS